MTGLSNLQSDPKDWHAAAIPLLSMMQLYPNNLKNRIWTQAKAPGIRRSKTGPYCNTGQFLIDRRAGLWLRPNSDSSGCLGIQVSLACWTNRVLHRFILDTLRVFEYETSNLSFLSFILMRLQSGLLSLTKCSFGSMRNILGMLVFGNAFRKLARV